MWAREDQTRGCDLHVNLESSDDVDFRDMLSMLRTMQILWERKQLLLSIKDIGRREDWD